MRGADLARAFSATVVEPLVERGFPNLPFATGRLGSGSDVLGFDDATSRDHDWGLRLTLLVDEAAVADVDDALERGLPQEFREHPVRFGTTWDPTARHRVEVASPIGFVRSRAGVDPSGGLGTADWLALTGQSILEVTAGPVFRDDTGEITALRERLRWYPPDVERFVLASAWSQLAEELPAAGRSGARGDELGSRIVAARLAHTVMQLGYLLERTWPPYAKWFGTGFAALQRAAVLAAPLGLALAADHWQQRQDHLAEAIEGAAALQGQVGLPVLRPAIEPFYERPFHGVRDVAGLLRRSIEDPVLRATRPVGSVEQFSSSVDLLVDAERRAAAVRGLLPPTPAG